jgi:hypothetical protein
MKGSKWNTFEKRIHTMFNKSEIEKYFNAEKTESLVFIIIGVVAVLAALCCLIWLKSSFSKGLAIPLITVALIQITVGYNVYRRSDAQRIDNVYAFDMDPAKLRNEEVPRMTVVMKNFVVYRWVELALLAAGIILVLVYRNESFQSFFFGLGIGLAVQSLLMLIADFFAEKRGQEYLDGLKHFLHLN